ncbi:MAG TPA: UPF0182 family protein [Gemmatimonadales bacterium]|nr:UPF0182 family protein [Gemmatimonadales bacterium]
MVALLFAGRGTAEVLADRWWAGEVSASAVEFLTDWHLLRGVLTLAGVVVAASWFIGNLVAVYRAVGSVQVRRSVANLEFREALTPGALLTVVLATGAVLGALVGKGAGSRAAEVALGWQGVSYGVLEPLLQRDVGLYIAQLPLWRDAQQFAFLLVTLGLALVFGLYILVGAIRWLDGRPAINNHARTHLGWLLVALALTLMWGYLLEPFELVAAVDGLPDRAVWRATTFVAPLLAGVAIATALLSGVWAIRARHSLAAAGWIVLPLASLVGHWLVPPALGGEGEPVVEQRTVDQFERLAYGLDALSEGPSPNRGRDAPPAVPSLWNPAMASRLLAADTVDIVDTDPAMLAVGPHARPVWLIGRNLPGGRFVLHALADDRTGSGGEAVYYRPRDSVPQPLVAPWLDLGPTAFHRGSPRYRLNPAEEPGVRLDSWLRRLLLAWSLQAPELLGHLEPGSRLDWALAPADRLNRLVPFAMWDDPVARIIDGELVWVADGYLPPSTFPLSPRIEWRRQRVAGLRASLIGTVSAQTGAVHVFLRPGSDALAGAWAAVAAGVIEPAAALPEAVWRGAPYPAELFRVQARQLERSPRRLGVLSGRTGTDPNELPRSEIAWADDTTGPVSVATYELPGERRLSALLVGSHEDAADVLRLVRLDSVSALPSRSGLESRWGRFATYKALVDSIQQDGGRLDHGPVRFDVDDDGVVAYQSHFAGPASGRPVLVWVAVATGERQGAGHTLKEAWSNLLGATVPAIAGQAQTTRLDDARRFLLQADSALRAADWERFGRAWSGLRRAVGLSPDSTRR